MPRFIIDLSLDGYPDLEEETKACRVFIKEQLDFSGSSVRIIKELPNDSKDTIEDAINKILDWNNEEIKEWKK